MHDFCSCFISSLLVCRKIEWLLDALESFFPLQAKYKEDYEKNKGRNFTEIPETNEMVLSKELRPVQSKKLYEEKSKEMLKNVSLGAGW